MLKNGNTVKIEHHLEEVGNDELSLLVNFENKSIELEKQLLDKIQLVRIGFYPDSKDVFAIFDYSIGEEITNYLIVINTNEKGS